MADRVCPWWLGHLLASPIRRLFQDPGRIIAPYVGAGMTVVEPGPGMGFFTLELARRVGPEGRVVAVDIQPRMLAGLRGRARRAGLEQRVQMRLAQPGSLGLQDLAGAVDFVLAFAMLHEYGDDAGFFAQVAAALKPGGQVLLAEPTHHVSEQRFATQLSAAAAAGLSLVERPHIRSSLAVVLRR